MLAAAQMTPEAVIANAPALPTPEQWGKYGHTEAFTAKIAELRSVLRKMVAAPRRISPRPMSGMCRPSR